jgi:aspartyl-tRNA(Asn)/glutamyl-tRNA(Gln) amidotransferase subunit A
MGSSTENSGYGTSRNPYDVSRVPGGSSGGSAVAVATGSAAVALGSETGGSVRQPAAFTNLLGLKPTYGRLSRYGLVAFASSMDQVGIFSRSAADGARTLAALSGHDPLDATSLPGPGLDFDALDLGEGAARGLTVGVPRALLDEGLDDDVAEGMRIVEAALQAAGATVRDVTLLPPSSWVATYYLLATAEASSNLARFDGIRYGLRKPAANVPRPLPGDRAKPASAPRSSGASCSAPMRSRRATTTPTTARRRRRGGGSSRTWLPRSLAATRCCSRPRRRPRSGSARRPTTRSRCT